MTINVPEAARLEIKFVTVGTDQHRVREWLRRHPAGFTMAHPDRTINNIYFDTFEYQSYADNLAGISRRAKVRYRWYGPSPTPDSGWLEIKKKRNSFGWKDRYRIDQAPYEPGFDWRRIRARFLAQLPPEGAMWLEAHPVPVMSNRYERQYYIDATNRLRVTLDTNQTVYDQRNGVTPQFGQRGNISDVLIVEFKFARDARDYVSGILGKFPIRSSRSSKYMTAVKAISFS
jgi:hypothetical protein